MECPKCHSEERVKNGHALGKPRYKCKGCGCNYTQSHKRGVCLEIKLQALRLYLEGTGLRSIGRILKVSNVTVLYWIRDFGKSIKAYVQAELPDDIREIEIVEMDEMWHFTKKKNTSFGSGLQLTEPPKKSLDFQWVVGVKKPSRLS